MRADAARALDGLSPSSPYRATMLHTQGLSWLLEGDLDRADELFTHAYDVAIGFDSSPLAAMVLAEQSLVATARGELAQADAMLKRAVGIVETRQLGSYWTSALVFAVAARSALRAARCARPASSSAGPPSCGRC